jgi:hypothetical protein
MSERERKLVNLLIKVREAKFAGKCEVGERGREMVNWVIKLLGESEVGEVRGEVVDWMVEKI